MYSGGNTVGSSPSRPVQLPSELFVPSHRRAHHCSTSYRVVARKSPSRFALSPEVQRHQTAVFHIFLGPPQHALGHAYRVQSHRSYVMGSGADLWSASPLGSPYFLTLLPPWKPPLGSTHSLLFGQILICFCRFNNNFSNLHLSIPPPFFPPCLVSRVGFSPSILCRLVFL